MKLDELITKAKDSMTTGMVFAEPYEKNGISVIAAARLAGGGGGGTRQTRRARAVASV